ncbi:MAG TPA: condensation domain-containing protein [Thermoanaerobaculia bacterium]|nr:condensation domain-containing protein [Thermoanaerobaculia bacterium]
MKGIDQRIAELPPGKLALLLERLEKAAAPEAPDPSPVRPRRRDDRFRPLSFAQTRLWFLDQLAPGGDYNVAAALRLRGRIDHRAFEQGVSEVLRRHEVLRAGFQAIDGRPVQILAEVRLTPARVDLSGLLPADREAEAERLARSEALRPFDLAQAPLLRVCWLEKAQGDQILLFTLHHIVCDGESMGILSGELTTLYQAFQRGDPSPLAELPVQYADYADWQREQLQGEHLERVLGYWRRQLQGAPAAIDLPGVLPERPGGEHSGADELFSFSHGVSSALKILGREELTTPFTMLVALFSVLLHVESGQADLCIGANIAHRAVPEAEGLVGFFVNQLVLRIRLSGADSFRVLLRRVQGVIEEAFEHQDLPFERLVEELCPERRSSRNPLFQVKVDFQEERPTTQWPGVDASGLSAVPLPTPLRCDLLLIGTSAADEISCTLSYDRGRFRAETVKHMALALVRIAGIVVAQPEIPLREVVQRISHENEQRRSAERDRLDRIGATKLRSARRKSVRA